MYKEASRVGLRFQTAKGNLTVEQLWTLSLQELDTLAVSLEEQYNNSKGKSFLDKTTTKDKSIKLRFDIVLDILKTLMDAEEALKEAREIKEHNSKIIGLIKEKQDEAYKGKSIKELEKLLR